MSSGAGLLGSGEFGQFPGSPADLRQSNDRDFLAGLNATVAVEYDVNSAGTTLGARLGRPANWQPVPGFEAVRCRFGRRRPGPTEGEARPGQDTGQRVLFGVALPADRRFRLAVEDPTYGLRHLYFRDRVFEEVDERGVFHHAVGVVQDRPLS